MTSTKSLELILLIGLCVACGGRSTEPPAGIRDGLVGLWKLDEPKGGTAPNLTDFADSSGLNVNGTHIGVVDFGAPGKIDMAASFSNGSHVLLGVAEPQPQGAVSTAAWIKTSVTVDAYPQVVSLGDVSGLTGYNLYLYNCSEAGCVDPFVPGAASFIVKEGNDAWGACWALGTTDVRDGLWHHLVGVYDGESISIYVDGTLQMRGTCTSQPINYGASPTAEIASKAGSSTFEGSIEQVAVWNRALGATDVTTLYAAGHGVSF